MITKKVLRIGIDLDGVVIGSPPFVPKKLLEYLYRGRINHKLSYRFPTSTLEVFIRKMSHMVFFRPPLFLNRKFLIRLSENPDIELFAVSGRYSFLKNETKNWMRFYNTGRCFKEIYINEGDENPNFFKERMIKKLKLDYFIDDDPLIVDYLKGRNVRADVLEVKNFKISLAKFLKLKILMGVSYFSPNISGLTIYAGILAQELVRKGNKVTVLTSRYSKKLKETEVLDSVSIKRIWTPYILGRGPLMPTFLFEAFKEVWKHDIVNLHTPQVEGIFLALWAKLLRKKIILTHHCDLSRRRGLLNILSERLVYTSLMGMATLSDSIVVYTKDYADHSDFLQKFKSKLIYCLPPVKLEKTTKLFARQKATYVIGFAGRIAQEKGLDILLEAIPFLEKLIGTEFKILFAGPYKEVIGGGTLDSLHELLDRYKKYVTLLGPIAPMDMAAFYRLIDVLVLPSVENIESFGFVQVEAMLSGVPVVASNMPGVRIPIKVTGMGEIVTIKDSKELAEKIALVLKRRKGYSTEGKKAKELFDYQNTISFYQKLFEK